MADISKELNQIKNAVYGREVRGSIHDGIDKVNRESEGSRQIANNTEQRQDAVEQQFNTLLGEWSDDKPIDNAETIAARTNTKESKTYENLGKRLDEEYGKVTRQLAETAELTSGNLTDLFIPPAQPDIHSYFSSGNAFAQGDKTTYDEYVALFENLYLENPDYIKRYSKGFDSSGWREWAYYVYEPKKYSKTIIISAGMHGGEKLGVISLYNFLKLIVDEWDKYPQLAYIKNHVRLVVMPLSNPAGIYFNNRVNGSRGVDLNRNFDYKWNEYLGANKGDSAASEFETKCIQSVLEEYKDAVVYIDIHNMSAGDRNFKYTHYIPAKSDFPTNKLKEIVHEISGFKNPQSIEVISSDFPMGTNYAASKHNMISFNPEYVPGVSVEAYGSKDMTTALGFYSNLIIHFCSLNFKNNFLQTDSWTRILSSRLLANDAYEISGNLSELSRFNFSFIPTINGLLEVEYVVNLHMENEEDWGNVVAVITQEGNDSTDGFYPEAPLTWHQDRFGNLIQGKNYQTVVTKSVMPIDVGKGQANIKFAAGTNSGTMKILRVRRFIKFTPSDRANRLIIEYVTSK